jgi:acid phosphatase
LAIERSLKALVCGLLLAGALASPAAARPALAEIWFQTSTECRAMAYQTYHLAEMQFDRWSDILDKREDGKAYLPGASKPVAIILDLDETVIDNSGFQAFCAKNDVGFSDDLWNAWIEFQGVNAAAGPAIAGAPELLAKVEAMGVTPIYISNRTVGQEDLTANVLKRNGISVDNLQERLLLRLPSQQETARAEQVMRAAGIAPGSVEAAQIMAGEGKKEARRRQIMAKYDVIALFGDQLGDFEPFLSPPEITAQSFKSRKGAAEEYRKNWGTTWFVLPNPMYGYWGPGQSVPGDKPESALQDYGFELYLRGRRVPVKP